MTFSPVALDANASLGWNGVSAAGPVGRTQTRVTGKAPSNRAQKDVTGVRQAQHSEDANHLLPEETQH